MCVRPNITMRACVAGYFKGQVGEAPCIKCAVGKFADSHQSTVCTLCLAGKYAAGAGSTKCFDCSPGSFIAKAGASACDDCSPGSYASLTGSSGCLLCPTGISTSVAHMKMHAVTRLLSHTSKLLTKTNMDVKSHSRTHGTGTYSPVTKTQTCLVR